MYREKMLQHLAAAEAAQKEVDGYERAADKLVKDKYGSKLAVAKNTTERESLRLYYINKELENHTSYRSAVGRRNSHREWARVYGVAALTEQADA